MPGKWALFAMALAATLMAPRAAFANVCAEGAFAQQRAAAMNAVDHAAGLESTKLYLEALHARGVDAKDPRPECFDVMAADVPKLLELHCAKSSGRSEDATCVLLDLVQVDVQRLNAQQIVERADKMVVGTGPSSRETIHELYDRGGRAYLEIFHDHCEEPSSANRPVHPKITHCMETGYNAARAFTAAHEMAKTIATYRMLIGFDERTKTHSPIGEKAVYELGAAYQAVTLYDEAATQYEKYASANPRGRNADTALVDAAILRLGLGQDAQAEKDTATFAKTWGLTKRAETAELALAVAQSYADKEAWGKATTVLTTSIAMLDRGPPDLTTRAHALLAHAYAKSSTPERAKPEYAKVRAVWNDPDAAENAIVRGWPNEERGKTDRRLARALNAVGEAMFAAAEDKRLAEVEPLKLPGFAGPHERAAVLAHIDKNVKPWFAKKKNAIERSEAEYLKLLGLRPVPPPLWVVAAAGVVGAIWGDFTDEMRHMPIPDAWRNNRALLRAYYDALDALSEPIKAARAKPAMKKCVELAAKYQVSDRRADACAAWLAASYKAEYHLEDEIIPPFRTPTGLGSAVPASALPWVFQGR